MDLQRASGAQGASPTGLAKAWGLVCVLAVLNTLATIDRNVIVLLLRPIQSSLVLTATQVSFAVGTSFAIASLAAGLVAGWMADRLDRRWVIASAVLLWSTFAMFTGTAGSFLALLFLRGGVGLTEGLLPAAGYSLMRDRIAPSHQARAFSVFSMGPLVGSGLAFIIGGALIGLVARWNPSRLLLLGPLPQWGIVLLLVGLPGLVLAAAPLLFAPDRRARRSAIQNRRDPGFWAEVRQNRRPYAWLATLGVAHAMLTGSLNFWVPTLLDAKFHLTPPQIGLVLGPLLLVLGPVGLYAAGLATDRLEAAGRSGPGVIALLVATGLFVFAVIHPLAPTPTMFWIFQGALILFATTYLVLTSMVVAQLASPSTMGRTLAIFLVVYGVLGGGLAPISTALAIDHLFAGFAHPIPMAMSIVHGLYGLLGIAGALGLYAALRQTGQPS
jgi:MFS transporter, Spinster family, sphingosine-1-phosphate transporter